MPSLDAAFSELRQRLRDRHCVRDTGGDPVFYLVFAPEDMLQVKRNLKAWTHKLALDDWHVQTLSLAAVIAEFFAGNPFRPFWLSGEREAPLTDLNKTLSAALVDGNVVEQRILEALSTLSESVNGLLIITDVEALHPYLRIGAVEQRIQGKVDVPMVVLYPGRRRGESQLSFLGIYPDDGNYRSIHIGG